MRALTPRGMERKHASLVPCLLFLHQLLRPSPSVNALSTMRLGSVEALRADTRVWQRVVPVSEEITEYAPRARRANSNPPSALHAFHARACARRRLPGPGPPLSARVRLDRLVSNKTAWRS